METDELLRQICEWTEPDLPDGTYADPIRDLTAIRALVLAELSPPCS